jgi:ABC-type transporter Mla MlaB component
MSFAGRPSLADEGGASVATHEGDARVLVCDVAAVLHPDAGTLDCLARVALYARRRGLRVCLQNASAELLELVAFAGLAGVLPAVPGASALETGRETEERKEPLRVEEEGDPADPIP